MYSDELLNIPKRRQLLDINIVPILDMLVTIIFFLLLSASFLQYNQLSIPPSKTSIVTSADVPLPLQARMILIQSSEKEANLILQWSGAQPGAFVEKISLVDDSLIVQKAKDLTSKFKGKFKEERTLQLGLGSKITYSKLITLMDAVRGSLPDIVLLSDVDAEMEGSKFLDKESL